MYKYHVHITSNDSGSKKEFKITFAYGMNSFEKNNQLSAILDSSDKAMYQFKKGARVSSVK